MSSALPFPFDGYYYSPQKSYLVTDQDKTWMQVSEKGLMLHLIAEHFSRVVEPGQTLSGVEKMILRIQNERNVVYAGPLAGYDAGMHVQGGYKVLVTHSPTYVKAAPGDWPLLRGIINGMFTTPEIDQAPFFHLWLKVSDESFVSKKFIPGPLLGLAGPGKSFKTFLGCVVTVILGGRAASPHRYMMGNTSFNSEFMGSEVLIIDDEHGSKDLRSRRNIGNHIKTMLFKEHQSGHGKKSNAFTLYPFWRMIFLLNDEPENLMVLPPIDESLEDKIILLKVKKSASAELLTSPSEKSAFWAKILQEIPAYLYWLRHEFKAPEGFLIDSRTGVINYKNPDLLSQLTALSPESTMDSLCNSVLFEEPVNSSNKEWNGSAEEVQRNLCNSDFRCEAMKLLSWNNATGTYLGRLAKLYPDNYVPYKKGDVRLWKIVKRSSFK